MKKATDYTDYHRYFWTVCFPPLTIRSFFLSRTMYIIPYLILSFLAAKKLSSIQKVVIENQLYWFIFTLLIAIILVIGTLDYFISKSIPRKILNCSISKKGIDIGGETTPLNNLNKTHLNKVISNPNRYSKKINNYETITLKASEQKIKLMFQNNTQQTNFLKAINKYFQINSS